MRRILLAFVVVLLTLSVGAFCVSCGIPSDSVILEGSGIPLTNLFRADDTPAEVRYTVSFSTGTSEEIASMQVLTLNPSQVPTPSASYKVGYRFEGWYLASDFSGSKLEFPYTFSRNTTIYAKWISNLTIRIENVEQLLSVKDDLLGSYALVRDLDLSQYGVWTPIGDIVTPFEGVFDGNGYSISNMTINDIVEDEEFNELPIGFFGKVKGQVKNVTLVDYKITLEGEKSRFMIGGIVGQLDGGTLLNSSAKGQIINSEMTYRRKFVDTFWVTAKPSTKVSLGGAVGRIENGGTVSGVSTEGSIISYSNATEIYCGGVVGSNGVAGSSGVEAIYGGTITSCHSITTIFGKCAGGLVGYNNGLVERSSATGFIEGSLSYPSVVGGLAAYNHTLGIINRSYATGGVKGRTAGGLIGVNKFDYEIATGGMVNNCYASGDVFASEYAGGLIGRAVSDIPYFGWEDFSGQIFNPVEENDVSGISFKAINHCLSYGNVIANASETTYENADGEEVRVLGVFYPVFAGGMVGQSNEMLIGNCIAFGDVEGISNRVAEEGGPINATNPAYVNNFVGHSTNTSDVFQNVYCVEEQSVERNGIDYSDFNTVTILTYQDINAGSYLRINMGFDTSIWTLTGLDVENGVYPTLLN